MWPARLLNREHELFGQDLMQRKGASIQRHCTILAGERGVPYELELLDACGETRRKPGVLTGNEFTHECPLGRPSLRMAQEIRVPVSRDDDVTTRSIVHVFPTPWWRLPSCLFYEVDDV